MAGLIYYMPRVQTSLKREDLEAAGLAYAFPAGVPFRTSGVRANGPDGGAGTVVADERHVPRLGYYKDEQNWRTIPGTDLWVGYYVDDRPAPAQLERPTLLEGHRVLMGDGQEWLAPIARGYAEADGSLALRGVLPWKTTVDDTGAWVQKLAPEHERLWNLAESFFDKAVGALKGMAQGTETSVDETIKTAAAGETELRLDFDGMNDAALTALSANYRLGRAEVGLLGLFNEQCVAQMLFALVDWPTLQTFTQKKTEAAGSVSAPGPPAGPPATGRP